MALSDVRKALIRIRNRIIKKHLRDHQHKQVKCECTHLQCIQPIIVEQIKRPQNKLKPIKTK